MLPTASLASVEEPAVRAILRQYQQAVEKLDTTGTHRLFAANSRVFESGGVEGTYRHYAAHHLAPELGEFSKFAFNNYRVVVEVDLPYAFATETYIYTINLKKGPKTPVVREGVATSVLRKSAAGQWQIVSTHTSAQKPQPKK
ncbi:MAG: nuclear transport factor 2 family protein [Hymenobacteraceae bacterium]|nr:nuclear transport factor 2 family protein [Hymenobacteraceae bacterium]